MRKVNIRGKEFQVTENQNLFWDKVEAGLWEPETFEVLEQFCKQGETFVDIGAWNGVCSIYANALGAKNLSFEPDSGIFNTLSENLKSNNCVVAMPFAVSDSEGVNHLLTCSSSGDSMSSLVSRGNDKLIGSVQTITLDQVIEVVSKTCLIKMDIEGGEVLVLKQAKEFLSIHKPTMYISLHPAWFPNPKEDLQMIIDVIFPIYKVCRMIDGVVTQYSRDRFVEAVERGEHSYILIAK
jgi:FkbM family methyltransferase